MDSDMDLLLDMMPDENIAYENVEPGKTNEYYQGHAEHILKQVDSIDHYFHFVNTILKNYHTLSEEQQQIIQDRLGIKPKIVEKVVIKEKIVYKKEKKARVNAFDDY
jgi:Mg2+ and Co2+ transporter CorA